MALPAARRSSDDLARWDPFAEFERIRGELDQLMRFSGGSTPVGFIPSADVEEAEDGFLIELELPGVKADDVDVELSGRRLSVTGERREKERTGKLRSSTRSVGRFHYELVLPGEIDQNGCEASFDEGVLTVQIPKAEQDKPKRIDVGR